MTSSGYPVYVRMACEADGGAHEDVIWSELLEWFSKEGQVFRFLKQREQQRIQIADADDKSCEAVASFLQPDRVHASLATSTVRQHNHVNLVRESCCLSCEIYSTPLSLLFYLGRLGVI